MLRIWSVLAFVFISQAAFAQPANMFLGIFHYDRAGIEYDISSDGVIYIGLDIPEAMLPQSAIDRYAPGSNLREAYLELYNGLLSGIELESMLGKGFEPLRIQYTLPDPDDYFDHHFKALTILRTMLDHAPAVPTAEFNDLLTELVEFQDAFYVVERINFESMTPDVPMVVFSCEELDQLAEALSMRFFLDLVPPLPDMTLTASSDWNSTLGPLIDWYESDDAEKHENLRTITFTASNNGTNPPSAIQFGLISEFSYLFLSPDEGCDQQGDTTICETPYDGGNVDFTILVDVPEFSSNVYEMYPEFHATLLGKSENNDWIELSKTSRGIQFSRCDAQFAKRRRDLEAVQLDLAYLINIIEENSRPIANLSGQRQFNVFELDGIAQGFQPPANQTKNYSLRQATDILSDVIKYRGADTFMRDTFDGLVSQQLSALDDKFMCESDHFVPLYASIEAAIESVHEQTEIYQTLTDQGNATTIFWQFYARNKLREFDQSRIFPTTPDSPEVQAAYLGVTSYIIGPLLNKTVALEIGKAAGASFAAQANGVGMLLSILQVMSSVYEYAELLEIEEFVQESTSWLEATAYFTGMLHRYTRLEDALAGVLAGHRQAEVKSCNCLRP